MINRIKACAFCGCSVTTGMTPHGTYYFRCLNGNCGVLVDTLQKTGSQAIDLFNTREYYFSVEQENEDR